MTSRTSATSRRDPWHGRLARAFPRSGSASLTVEKHTTMSTTLTTTHRPGTTRHGGFTLVEVLVVVGIMVLIAGIAIPMINKARKAGIKTRVAADLQSVGVGLDAYRNDFTDYPRFSTEND